MTRDFIPHLLFWLAFALVSLAIVGAWIQAWRSGDIQSGKDPAWTTWGHRRYLELPSVTANRRLNN